MIEEGYINGKIASKPFYFHDKSYQLAQQEVLPFPSHSLTCPRSTTR